MKRPENSKMLGSNSEKNRARERGGEKSRKEELQLQSHDNHILQ